MYQRSDFDNRGRHKDKHIILWWSEILAQQGKFTESVAQSLIESGCLTVRSKRSRLKRPRKI